MQGIGYTGELECGFIRKSADPEIRYQKLKPTSKKQLKHMTESYINNIGERNQCFYRMAQGNPENMAEMSEWSFNYEANKLAKEIVENIEKLKQHGYEQMLLNYLNMSKVVEPERFSKLSRLHITKDYRVLLPDFQNLEISLTPLPKTVFLLFIRHPEGIVLKYLSDYRDELLEIYKQISLRENYNDIISSIDELVNPTKNSINEKCSRIKEAFVKHFSENIANFYYITGERGQPKQIKLDRNLVQWDGTEIPLITNPRSAKEIEQIEDDIYNNLKAGRDKSQQKDFITAIEHFSNVITLAPYHGNAYAERALAFSALGKYHDSERDNSAAIEIDKEILYAFHNRAEDRLFLENYKGALEDINHYLSLKTECKDSYFLRGLIYEKTGNLEMACRDWLTAKKLGREGMDSYLNNYPNIKVRKIKRKV
jgi:tetratricopeptide (TPR) repeat protein